MKSTRKPKRQKTTVLGMDPYSRVFLGIVALASGRSPPMAYALYEERYRNGTSRVVRGSSIYTYPTFGLLNPKGRSKAEMKRLKDEYIPELLTEIRVATELNDHIGSACRFLDNKRGLKEF